MFVYQNKDNNICVVFDGNKPVTTPDYVIVIDEDAKTISINGAVVDSTNSEVVEDEVVEDSDAVEITEEPTPVVEIPTVEEDTIEEVEPLVEEE